ncbi:hypothetical protein [Hamadaea sp.]|uniref:hypothetical protein n=1 Tax=Hamadaea sp. TaxID=2024425 RepID=UPI0025BA69C3|nr:hypothetical protein [Hamadaea sp.]
MGNSFVVSYQMRPETADENQRLIEDVFAELAGDNPDGLRYASFRLADGVTFVHMGTLPDDANPLADSAAFREFQRAFGDRAATSPKFEDARLLGAYGFGE